MEKVEKVVSPPQSPTISNERSAASDFAKNELKNPMTRQPKRLAKKVPIGKPPMDNTLWV